MAKIKCEQHGQWFEIDLTRISEKPYEKGSLIIYGTPFWGIPLELELGITPAGEILFRHWKFVDYLSNYFQTDCEEVDVNVTPEMQATLSGLFSKRITFEGIKIAIGATPQKICPLDLTGEEIRSGKKIYLA